MTRVSDEDLERLREKVMTAGLFYTERVALSAVITELLALRKIAEAARGYIDDISGYGVYGRLADALREADR